MKNLIILFSCLTLVYSCSKEETCFQKKASLIAKWQLENEGQNPFVYKTDKAYCEIETSIVGKDTILNFTGNKRDDYFNTSVFVNGKKRVKIIIKENLNNEEKENEQWQKKMTKYAVDVFYDKYVKKPGD